jgi:hypothetical protein
LSELMLVHACEDCQALSINRIAADDDPHELYAIFTVSLRMEPSLRARLDAGNIRALRAADQEAVSTRLFGLESDPAGMLFQEPAFEMV